MKTDKKSITTNHKGLQKLTESENNLDTILALHKITLEDLGTLDETNKNEFLNIMTQKLNSLKGDELENFCTQIEDIMHPRVKNELWEKNHINIMWGISVLIRENGRMPTKTEISSKTELSRQTVHKHLKEYKNSIYYTEFQEQFGILQSKIMSSVFQHAIGGDMKAAKLYLECIGALKNTSSANQQSHVNNTLIQNQNNMIQINGMILNQETIQKLKPEQLNTIEGILKTIEIKESDQI
ncbi:hypothetical protein C1637_21990 [Chryseobacterium lactis]|uniref:Uncharacterized protein n=1 Tax=Chryseobacterium lactis TaxID=1241981 RepID=A0A3G6RK34_CHRLC|nr:hypothetical protein [Chryseobacterium lactis]AZA84954.1 hypothetical protein EG342_24950 [Chryseobacterium lactis]AZB05342.1 hypothetical protein EG341_15830 [Chryseobacterium lactis]PNW11491.1 hypothetical protein C1637_21990 [Chryseobacterium lactis]